jgi:hypothetical protein
MERLFLTKLEVAEMILAAEEELIDDYLENRLTPAESQKFLERYARTPVQRRRLRIRTSIKNWAEREGKKNVQ